jgi:Sulfatase
MSSATRRGQAPWVGALQLWALWSFAVVQPLLSILAGNTTFFLYHRAVWSDVVLLVAILCLPALGFFWLVEWASARIGPRVALGSRVTLLALLAGLLFVQPLERSPLVGAGWVLPWTLLAVSALVVAYLRLRAVRSWLTMLSAAAPVFVGLFFLAPEVRGLAALDRGMAAEPAHRVSSQPDVVLVVFDALPLAILFDEDFAIDRQLFPNFARLADTSHWFRNASTPASLTEKAVPSILTGNASKAAGAATLTAYPENLFTLLDPTHRIEAFETVTRMVPRATPELVAGQRPGVLAPVLWDLLAVYRHLTTPAPWAEALSIVDENWGGFAHLDLRPRKAVTARGAEPADPRGSRFLRFVELIKRREESQFFYHHALLPHGPVRYLPSGRRYRELVPREDRRDLWWVDGESVAPKRHLRYILQVQYADTLLGRLLDRLEAAGLLDTSVLVVCADHGETLQGGSRHDLAHVGHPDDILRVPLFIKSPGQTSGVVDDRNVDLRDVTPAIAGLLGIDLPWEATGHSPFAPDFPQRAGKRLVDGQGTALEFAGEFSPDLTTRALIASYFPPGHGWRGLYRFGPMPELVGRSVEDLDSVETDFSVVIDEEDSLLDLDAASEIWPVRLSGTLDYPEAPPEAVLALAVGGRIEATVRAKFRAGQTVFSTFVGEQAIKAGSNRVEVLLVEEGSGVVRRAPTS